MFNSEENNDEAAEDYAHYDSILPTDKTFLESFLPYFGPYALYVAIGAIQGPFFTPEIKQIAKFIAVSIALAWFFKRYQLGKLIIKHAGISIVASPVAILLWIVPLYYIKGSIGTTDNFTSTYFALRMINSTFLVAIFEELFIRVYLMQWLYRVGIQLKTKGIIGSILETLEQRPTSLDRLPLSYFSVIMVTILFAAGHTIKEWVSAILYFSFTNYMYRKTGSIWVCILIHGIANLAIALLVRFGGMAFLWV